MAEHEPGINITILGATGSIGASAIDVIRRLPDRFRVETLTCHSNWERCLHLARQAGAKRIVIGDERHYREAKSQAGTGIDVQSGPDALMEAAREETTDIVVSAIVGSAGLLPTLAAIQAGKRVALANKESMVIAGSIMTEAARESNAEIIPVDSEHSAIFQCLMTGRPNEVDSLILTASGGPFRTSSHEIMNRATVADALNHPTWSDMGRKITIDSATLMNKALEIIEASRLFGIPEDRIEVFVHPQSMIHSMVRWQDGSIIAQLGMPDMRVPIQLALCYPDRPKTGLPTASIEDLAALTFERPDHEKFPSLRFAREAARRGQCASAALNAANEIAVDAFLNNAIRIRDIFDILRRALDEYEPIPENCIENILETDRKTRERVRSWIV